ncbi:MAG: hypothetical protein COV09_00040 [Candidatus Vogelbacteria bacterium CG10_big_fil_rev_8_21_14_0_10_50_13]|uniref:Glycosyltransferase RgtA/B/C/D-like domain-containing protein n=1 Tax=Candidatus Vogelbacteria bacterium CG10_big_fil_rev_8_21_14_0_10_50_13 TaxID=1975044 RepID=A0A2H0RGL8_9BACT|nr:MAG: hypothetical protein COV09_00040 [Candidatus Vogelbacteria bacterium CG10_big_fil_rev_8_21_14_0_10_50_13]
MLTAVVIALSALIQLVAAFQPLDFLVANVLPDDAFYYFEIARNIVAGHGSSFDGVNLTNGYHPLWLILNLPAFAWFDGHLLPIQFLLLISIGLNVLTAVFLSKIFSRLIESKLVKNLLLAVYLFNPFVLFETLNGLETALSLSLITLFIWWWLKVSDWPTMRNFVLAGLIGGLMMLARLDNIFFFGAFILWVLATRIIFAKSSHRLLPVDEGKSRPIAAFRSALVSGLVAVLIISPWVIWNWLTFGMVSTSAANTASLVVHGLVAQDNGGGLFVFLKTIVYMLELNWQMVLSMTSAPGLWFLALGAWLYWWWQGGFKISRQILTSPLTFFTLAWFAMFLANAGWRWVGRGWYFIGFNILIVILLAWFWHCAKRSNCLLPDDSSGYPKLFPVIKGKSQFLVSGLLVLLLIFSYALDLKREILNRYQPQLAMIEAAEWGNANFPAGSVIGVFNAGVQGYLSEHRVVNLDGLVNNAAARAIAERELWPYALGEVDYFSDFPIYLDYRYRSFLGITNPYQDLELLATVGTTTVIYGQTDGLRIFKVK